MTPLSFIHTLADLAGEVLRPYYRSPLVIDSKGDRSPVTEADRAVERALREAIRKAYPEHGIVGEEYGAENPDAEFCWYLDPIDGTLSFMHGKPLFTTLIALCHRGIPVLGCIDQPILGDRWVGGKDAPTVHQGSGFRIQDSGYPLPIPPPQAGEGTGGEASPTDQTLIVKRDGASGPLSRLRGRDREGVLFASHQPLITSHCKTRPYTSLAEASFSTTSPYLFNPQERAAFERIREQCRYTLFGGDAYAYGMLASGQIDLVVEAGLQDHDFLPLVAVIEGAGGIMTDWEGNPLTTQSDGRVIAAGDRRVHAQVVGMLSGGGPM
jgi:inositol-phosphate phosphatase/L-galactose 1-phosphate phosphatase/histidinol-phosphatase